MIGFRSGACLMVAMLLPQQGMAQSAEPAPPPSSERRLTPEQVEAVLAEAARKRETAPSQIHPRSAEPSPSRRIHGEVGLSVGTGGYREVFGTAIYPVGDDGVAAISMDFVDLGKRRPPR